MITKTYRIPELILDAKEEKALESLTETYNKMIAPNAVSKAMKKGRRACPSASQRRIFCCRWQNLRGRDIR